MEPLLHCCWARSTDGEEWAHSSWVCMHGWLLTRDSALTPSHAPAFLLALPDACHLSAYLLTLTVPADHTEAGPHVWLQSLYWRCRYPALASARRK